MAGGERIHIRSAMGKSLYDRLKRDEDLRLMDKSQWYQVDLTQVTPANADLFLPLSLDSETDAFLNRCHEKSDWVFSQFWHTIVKSILTFFMTQTSINGLLRRGSMFVFSREQFVRLLGVSNAWRADRLLDLGSGDGQVTEVMAGQFDSASVTEVSGTMRSILRTKGFTVLEVDSWHERDASYDVISCLNVLDRCDRPLALLKQMRQALRPGGVAVVALVLPLSPYVESGANGDHSPVEAMNPGGSTFARQVSGLIDNVFVPAGFQVVRWSRVPYLCEGDMDQAFYWLNDAVFVLRPAPQKGPVEVAAEASAEASREASVDASVEAAVETPVEASAEAAVDALVEAAVERPVDASAEAAAEAAVETPVDASAEAAVDASMEPATVGVAAPEEGPAAASDDLAGTCPAGRAEDCP